MIKINTSDNSLYFILFKKMSEIRKKNQQYLAKLKMKNEKVKKIKIKIKKKKKNQ